METLETHRNTRLDRLQELNETLSNSMVDMLSTQPSDVEFIVRIWDEWVDVMVKWKFVCKITRAMRLWFSE